MDVRTRCSNLRAQARCCCTNQQNLHHQLQQQQQEPCVPFQGTYMQLLGHTVARHLNGMSHPSAHLTPVSSQPGTILQSAWSLSCLVVLLLLLLLPGLLHLLLRMVRRCVMHRV
jgi:hypothetical protein